jgi:predicted transcriptional regulator YheO
MERFPADLEELLTQYLEDARQEAGGPLNLLEKQEKIALVGELEEKGFFRIKGSVEALARALGHTKYTVYAYLREARKK